MTSDLVKEGKNLWSKATSGIVQQLERERDKTFERTSGSVTKRDDVVDDLVRVSASGVGLFSEAAHYRRDQRGKRVQETRTHQGVEDPHSRRVHEAIWDCDNAAQSCVEGQDGGVMQDIVPKDTSPTAPKTSEDLATAFLRRHPIERETESVGLGGLTKPVVLPQRRPKTRVRGFVRAYAPILADVGVDQGTFLDFVDTFNKSLIPNPYLYAINLAGLADIIAPDPALTAFGILLGVAVEGIMEAQSRFKSNTFLDRLNRDYFVRHGLICVVATWKPDTKECEVAVDFDGKTAASESELELSQHTIDEAAKATPGTQQPKNLRETIGRKMKAHHGQVGWSEPAPLIFPGLEEKCINNLDTNEKKKKKKKNALDRAEIWLDGYIDKRAQVDWVEGNPDHVVANSLPRPEFKSRYANPSHPAASGDIVSFVTGGSWQYKRKPVKSSNEDHHLTELQATSQTVGGGTEMEETGGNKKATRKSKSEDIDTTSGAELEKEARVMQQDVSQQNVAKLEGSTTSPILKPMGPLTRAEADKELKEKRKEEKKAKEAEKKMKEKEKRDFEKEHERLRREEKKRLEMEKEARKAEKSKEGTKGTKPSEIVKSLFQNDVLYLVLVSLPQKEQVVDVSGTVT